MSLFFDGEGFGLERSCFRKSLLKHEERLRAID